MSHQTTAEDIKIISWENAAGIRGEGLNSARNNPLLCDKHTKQQSSHHHQPHVPSVLWVLILKTSTFNSVFSSSPALGAFTPALSFLSPWPQTDDDFSVWLTIFCFTVCHVCLRGESEADIKRWCSGWDIHGWKYRLERCGRWSRISLISSAWTDSCSRYRVTSVNLCYPAGVWWERSTSRSPRPERGWIYSTLPPDPLDLHPSERV